MPIYSPTSTFKARAHRTPPNQMIHPTHVTLSIMIFCRRSYMQGPALSGHCCMPRSPPTFKVKTRAGTTSPTQIVHHTCVTLSIMIFCRRSYMCPDATVKTLMVLLLLVVLLEAVPAAGCSTSSRSMPGRLRTRSTMCLPVCESARGWVEAHVMLQGRGECNAVALCIKLGR